MKKLVYSVKKHVNQETGKTSYPMNFLRVNDDGGLYYSHKSNVDWLEEEQYEELKDKKCPFYVKVPSAKFEIV